MCPTPLNPHRMLHLKRAWEAAMDAVEMDGVDKQFSDGSTVLHGVTLRVPEGGIYGFLGPNGAGKTTTVRIINGVLGISKGAVRVLGRPLHEHGLELRRLCGVLTETANTYEQLTAEQNLHFYGRLFGMPHVDVNARTDELLALLDLSDARHRKVGQFSTGMKKRLGLARALLHRPRLLFLDEPTNGLDPEAARNVTRFIQTLAAEQGVTVFLCTHQLKYAQDICTRYGFIHKGRLLAEGSMEELLKRQGHRPVLHIRGRDIPAHPGLVTLGDGRFEMPVSDDEEVGRTLAAIVQRGGHVYEARQSSWDLERLYFSFVEGAHAA
jgi:ABC-2 type transport system ATP-binding protein